MLLFDKSILTYPSYATFCYAINVCGIKLLIFGQHFSVPPTSALFYVVIIIIQS